MNHITVTGRLCFDPQLSHTPKGTPLLRARLAVDRMGSENSTGYVDVASFGPAAEGAAKVLEKGWKVAVDGQLRYSEWTAQDGTKRSRHEIVGYIEILAAPQHRDRPEPAEPAAAADRDAPQAADEEPIAF